MRTIGRAALRGLSGLVIAGAACGTGAGDADVGGPSGGLVPQELVGSWYYGSVSPSNYYDPTSGHWDNAYGDGMFFTFNANGTFEFGYRVYAGSYGCNNTVMFYKTGTVSYDPATRTLVTKPNKALVNSRDNCRPEWNYEKEIARDPETWIWRFGKDEWNGDALFLRYPTTEETAFYPWHQDQ